MSASYELAEKDYLLGMKYKDIAEKYGVALSTVKSWKTRYKWTRGEKGMHTTTNGMRTKVSCEKDQQLRVPIPEENKDLTEKQRLFCLYYIKSFNATMAAIKAGYSKDSASQEGSRLLRNDKIASEIKRLKGKACDNLFIDAMDVLQQYSKIAFADLGDYVEFGGYSVKLNESIELDTSVLVEVKEGKEGIGIKLADKMKALEMLTKYFDLLPDQWQRKVDEEKLKLSKAKLLLDIEKAKGESKSNPHVDALRRKMLERKMKNELIARGEVM